MASITVTLTDHCGLHGGAGNHLRFSLTGDRSATVAGEQDAFTGPVTDDDLRAFVQVLVKIGKINRTNAQLRTLFQAGVVVTV